MRTLLVLLVACGGGAGTQPGDDAGGGGDGGGGDGGGGAVPLPPVNAKVDYQLGGAYTPPAGVTVVSRDRTESPAPGI